jgi:ABC-2 type transport system permease protein
VVATVLRLRFRILANTLLRRPWQLVGFCFGALGALSILGLVTVGSIVLGLTQEHAVVATTAVIGGAALLVGWVIGPIVVAGMDSSIDAGRLAPFPLTRRQTMLALTATGGTGVPGITTALAALAASLLWLRWPAALIIAVPAAAVAAVTCVLASQLVATISAGLGANRRGRELVGTVVLAVVIMSGPIITGGLALADRATGWGPRLDQAAGVLGWTPLGAAWSAAGEAASGAWPAALAKLAIAVGTATLVWIVWARTLETSAVAPRRTAARASARGRLGLFGWMPSGPIGATWARSLNGWLRDPRYIRQLLIVPLMPVLFAFAGGVDGAPFLSSAVLVALVLAIATYADISYDGTAFAAVLAAGVRGREDRLGRMLGAASVGIPLVVVTAVVTTAVAGALAFLPVVLGAALGLLLAGYAVTAVSSALIVAPVAAPGDSPFKTVPGQTFLSGLIVFVVMGAIVAVASPSLATAVVALMSDRPAIGWIALAVALVVGAAAIAVGVVVGGRAFDRNGPDLLARIASFPTS